MRRRASSKAAGASPAPKASAAAAPAVAVTAVPPSAGSLTISAPPQRPVSSSASASSTPRPAAEKDRFIALDVIRLILTALVTVFHGLSELTFFLTDNEVEAMLKSPLGRVAAVGQGCVDGFFALSGVLAVRALLKRYADKTRPKPTVREVLDGYYSRFVGLLLPMFLWAAIYLFSFRNGKYPYSSVRADAVIKGVLHSSSSSAANATATMAAPAAAPALVPDLPLSMGTMRDSGELWWPWMVAGLGNLAPFGGLLQHTWSLAVQWQFYLFLPWIPFLLPSWPRVKKLIRRLLCLSVSRKDGTPLTWKEEDELEAKGAASSSSGPDITPTQAIKFSLFGLFWTLLFRFIAYRKLSDFDPKSLVGFGLDFAAYSNTATRMAPFFAGAIVAALSSDEFGWLVDWFKGGHSRRWHIALSRNALVRLLDLNVVVLTLVNAFWKELAALPDHDPVTGKTKKGYLLIHELAYGFVRPGGILSAVAYAWLIFSAMHGISWRSLYTRGRRSVPPTPVAVASDAAAPAADADAASAPVPSSSLRRRGTSQRRGSASPALTTAIAPSTEASPSPSPSLPRSPSLGSKLMGLMALMGFSIYLVNSQLYEAAYGWPDRLHPCPQLLHPGAKEAGDKLLYRYYEQGASSASAGPAARLLHWVESTASRVVTSVFSFLRGPDDLYCHPQKGVPSGFLCRGVCFGNSLQPYDDRTAAQKVFLAAEGMGAGHTSIPTMAWVQFLHYAAICIFLTLVVAAAFHFLVERPVTGALNAKDGLWRRVFYWPVVVYCLVTLALSLPALIVVDGFIMVKVTKAVEAAVAAGQGL